jgi:hypothetical protein
MSTSNVSARSIALRAPDGFSISEGLPERRPVPRVFARIRAWLYRPSRPPDLPNRLREDIGLPPLPEPVNGYIPAGPDLGRAIHLDRL